MVKLGMITIDTTDPRELATWWAGRLGGQLIDQYDGWFCMVTIPDTGLNLGFQKIEQPTPGKNRIHLDFSDAGAGGREQVIAEWIAAGATHLGTRGDENFAWDTFADPHGDEFCVSDPH